MRNTHGSGATIAVLTIAFLGLGACSKHEEPAPVAALPPAPLPPSPPLPPPAPTADDQLQTHLAELGATTSDGGWLLTLSSSKFHADKMQLSSSEQSTVEKIASLLKDTPHLRLQIENYVDKRGAKARIQELSQMQANAVLRDLIASGADASRIQAQGLIDTSKAPRIEILFSNAEGEFHPAPLENS